MAIDLIFFNDGILVFDVEHWIELRKTYRIIGEIIGNTAFVPSLPLKINPEEVLLLLDKGIVNVLRITSANSDPTVSQQKLMHFENELLQSQTTEYKKSRRIQLESMLDKIVAKRRETGDTSALLKKS
ncbi:hypothetical protein NQ317_010742 [Molorchus minor]|uniref:TSEN34 N-terminal domain-containing protein n=1 Tax=Molorchus minor TaxID=1323400 RepID=A0ABQ9JEF6_9CUCU|nr:hypothetical protein NQ317_010742 [Molorchus minor]